MSSRRCGDLRTLARRGRLAAYSSLRLGEIRALTWADVDLQAGTLTVRRSLLPIGTPQAPKTEAGVRTVPLLRALRRLLVAWKLRSPYTKTALVIATADGKPVSERNLHRALEAAKDAASLSMTDEQLSWHPCVARSRRCSQRTSRSPRQRSRA